MTKSLYVIITVLFLVTVISCSESTSTIEQEVELSASEIWSDTIIKQRYENGEVQVVWGYRVDDTIMHYEWTYYKNGELWMEGPMYDSLRHGKWKAYNEGGIMLAQGSYKMGEGTGVKTVWHDNEMKYYEGEMENNKRVGSWQFFDKDGRLLKEIDYSENDSIIHE